MLALQSAIHLCMLFASRFALWLSATLQHAPTSRTFVPVWACVTRKDCKCFDPKCERCAATDTVEEHDHITHRKGDVGCLCSALSPPVRALSAGIRRSWPRNTPTSPLVTAKKQAHKCTRDGCECFDPKCKRCLKKGSIPMHFHAKDRNFVESEDSGSDSGSDSDFSVYSDGSDGDEDDNDSGK